MKKLLFIAVAFVLLTSKVDAAALQFDKTSYSVTNSGTFDVEVKVDPGSEEITSVDAYVLYDSAVLQVDSVNEGSYFPTVLSDLQTGKAYIAGLVDNPSDFKTGVGTVATITFRAVKDGTVNLTYDCQQGASNTSKIIKNDINATNVITCSENGSATVTAGVGGTVTTITPAPTSSSSSNSSSSSSSSLPNTGGGTLPQSGGWENVKGVAIPGAILVIVGGIVKVLLKI